MPASDDELAAIEYERLGDTVRAVVRGEVDMSNADEIGVQLRAACNGAGTLVLDLSELAFLDSHGVATIFELHREMAGRNRDLEVFADAGSIVARVLDLTGLTQVVPTTYAAPYAASEAASEAAHE